MIHKDLLSSEELTELLSHVPEDHVPQNESDAPPRERQGGRSPASHRDLAYQYWQETVLELQREVARLRNRIEVLEKRQSGAAARKETAAAAEKKPLPAPQAERPVAEPDPAVNLSRVERYKAQKGKWF